MKIREGVTKGTHQVVSHAYSLSLYVSAYVSRPTQAPLCYTARANEKPTLADFSKNDFRREIDLNRGA